MARGGVVITLINSIARRATVTRRGPQVVYLLPFTDEANLEAVFEKVLEARAKVRL